MLAIEKCPTLFKQEHLCIWQLNPNQVNRSNNPKRTYQSRYLVPIALGRGAIAIHLNPMCANSLTDDMILAQILFSCKSRENHIDWNIRAIQSTKKYSLRSIC